MNLCAKLRESRPRLFCLLAVALAALWAPSAPASPVTFAQFMQSTTNAEPFVYTNNSTGATFNAATFNINLVIASSFLPPGTNTLQAATLTLTSSTSTPATQMGSSLLESFPTVASDTLQITLANP